MTKKYLFGAAAGIALLAAGSAAQAADVPQITAVAVTPTAAPVAAAGPALEFTIEMGGWYEFVPCCDYEIEPIAFEGVVDFQRPAGWGFQIFGGVEVPGYDYYVAARAYRDFGNLTFGAYLGTYNIFDWTALEPGFDIEYSAGNVTVYNDTYFDFAPFNINSDTYVEFALNERLTVYGGVELVFFDGTFVYLDYVEVGAELDLGNITPYAYFHTDFDGFWGFDIGAEFERQLGTGPFSLFGYGDIGIHPGNYTDIEVGIGLKFARGEVNTPWWW